MLQAERLRKLEQARTMIIAVLDDCDTHAVEGVERTQIDEKLDEIADELDGDEEEEESHDD